MTTLEVTTLRVLLVESSSRLGIHTLDANASRYGLPSALDAYDMSSPTSYYPQRRRNSNPIPAAFAFGSAVITLNELKPYHSIRLPVGRLTASSPYIQ